MTDTNYPNSLLQIQCRLLDEISVNLAYAKAMASVAIGADMHLYEEEIIHDYWGAMFILLEKIVELQQQLAKTCYQPTILPTAIKTTAEKPNDLTEEKIKESIVKE